MTAPLQKYEKKYNDSLKEEIIKSSIEKAKLEKQKASYLNGSTTIKIEELTSQIANFKEVKKMRIFVDDITCQKLTSVMAENEGRISILSAEGGIFDIMDGRYNSNKPDIDIFLKGFSGDTIKIDRISRESEEIISPNLTLLIAMQPCILNNIINNSLFKNKGLIARFLFCFPKSKIGNRNFYSEPISEKSKQEYEELIYSLLDLPNNKKILYFSETAQSLLSTFHSNLEENLNFKYYGIRDFVGKVEGIIARIATLLQLAINKESLYIEEDTLELAIEIGEYFIKTLENIMYENQLNSDILNQNKILEFIIQKHIVVFTIRDIQRNCIRGYNSKDIKKYLDTLVKKNYIYYSEEKKVYVVNPNFLLDKYDSCDKCHKCHID